MATEFHDCAVDGCYVRIPKGKLMCIKHWRKVTPSTQRDLYRAWGAWQRGTLDSPELYFAAAEQAKLEARAV